MFAVPEFPTHLQIQTTSACGADCSICPHPIESPKWSNRLMDDELFESIAVQLTGRKIDYLSPYLMADPLSDKKIVDRISRLRQVLPTAHLEASTTGLYLTPRVTDRLLTAPLTELRISSHGMTRAEYAKTMPGVDFDRAMANILRFIDQWQDSRPFRLSIVCLWGLWPAEREAEIESFWQAKGVELSKWRVTSRAQQVDLTVFGDGSADPTKQPESTIAGTGRCRFNRDTEWMHILSDGRVVLCCMDYRQEVVLGDARKDALADIWNGSAYRKVRDQVRGASPPDFLCRRCEWYVDTKSPDASASDARKQDGKGHPAAPSLVTVH